MAGSVCGVTLVKTFTYKDTPDEEWSNTYWLTGATPSDNGAWEALFSALISVEVRAYAATSSVVRALGYGNGATNEPAVHIKDYPAGTHPGTLVDAGGHAMSGDQAGVVEWKTDHKNKRGKWVYLRKYMHDGFVSNTDRDKIGPATRQKYDELAALMLDQTSFGGRVLTGPTMSYNQIAPQLFEWVTTRTLKRRGKRPLPRA